MTTLATAAMLTDGKLEDDRAEAATAVRGKAELGQRESAGTRGRRGGPTRRRQGSARSMQNGRRRPREGRNAGVVLQLEAGEVEHQRSRPEAEDGTAGGEEAAVFAGIALLASGPS